MGYQDHSRRGPLVTTCRECHRFCHGFTRGTGRGTDFCTPEKPVSVPRVHGFDPISNSARKRGRLPAHHSNCAFPPTTTTNHHSRIAKEGEWVVHPLISSKGMLSFGLCLAFVTNLKLYRLQVIPHISPPSKTSAHARFWWWWVVLQH